MEQGQILKHEDGSTAKILGICGEVYFLSLGVTDEVAASPRTLKEIKDEGYIIPEEKWKPEIYEEYYVADPATTNLYSRYTWSDNTYNNDLLEKGLVFRTKEEAIKAAEKMLGVLV